MAIVVTRVVLSFQTMVIVFWLSLERTRADILLTATPSATVAKGSAVQVICYVHDAITPSGGRCTVSWSRTYLPGREWQEENIEGATIDQPRYYTTTDPGGQPLSSSVHIAHMKESYRGAYKCTLNCDNYSSSSTISIDIITVPVTFGATVGTLSAFLVVSIVLLIAFFVGCRQCWCRPSRDQASLNNSSESLLRQRLPNSDDDENAAPPRYSVVVALPPDGSSIEAISSEGNTESVGGLLVLDPPSYDEALRDLEAKGVIINTNKLKPMPPAYCEIPFVSTECSSSALDMSSGATGGSPA